MSDHPVPDDSAPAPEPAPEPVQEPVPEPAHDLEYDLAHEAAGFAARIRSPRTESPTLIVIARTDGERDGDYGYDLAHDVPGR